jgi:hypothetical protein
VATTVTNLVQGPADLYIAAVSVTEPLDTAVVTAPGVGYTDLGGTVDGVDLIIKQDWKELEVDQVVDVPGSRLVKRVFQVKTKLAEPTLETLAKLTPSGAIVSGTGVKSLEPAIDSSATQPTYFALLIDGYAPGVAAGGTSFRRRVLVRRVLSTDDVKFSYMKDKQSVFEVTFSAHYVSAAVKPFKIVDQTT